MKSKPSIAEMIAKAQDTILANDSRTSVRIFAQLTFFLLLTIHFIVLILDKPETLQILAGMTAYVLAAPPLPMVLGLIAIGIVLAMVANRQ